MSLAGSDSPSLVNTPVPSTSTFNTKQTDAAYVGGRVGYLVKPAFLAYADGGWTTTHFVNSPSIRTAFGAATGFDWPNYSPAGWFVGGGAEYALSGIVPINGLFWRSEYRFASYSRSDIAEFFIPTGAFNGNVEHITPYVQTIASGFVWRFNSGGPLATRD
jgi:opacity protein-like surface antigen